jgi:hypothetical protein
MWPPQFWQRHLEYLSGCVTEFWTNIYWTVFSLSVKHSRLEMLTSMRLSGWVIAAVAVFAAVRLLRELGRSLPLQNLLVIATILLAGEGMLEWYLSGYLPGVFLWPGLVLTSRKWAQAILTRRRSSANYGVWLILVTALLTAVWQLIWEPAIETVLVRFVATSILLVLLVPWFIQKRPVTTSVSAT